MYFSDEISLLIQVSLKIYTSGFTELVESISFILLVGQAFSLQKVAGILVGVAVGWVKVR